jgi:hypothetical protein
MRFPSHPAANWWKALDERDRKRRKESERVAAYYKQTEREAGEACRRLL